VRSCGRPTPPFFLRLPLPAEAAAAGLLRACLLPSSLAQKCLLLKRSSTRSDSISRTTSARALALVWALAYVAQNFDEVATEDKVKEFFLPVLLTLCFIPFLYVVGLLWRRVSLARGGPRAVRVPWLGLTGEPFVPP
jgi:hypothetical protein